MVSMNELKQDMITGMGYIGLDSGRLYRMRRGPKLIEAVASGTTIIINDATEGRPFRGLRVFGKSTQVRTTGAQLFDAKTCLKSQIEKGVVSINSDGRIVLKGVIDANNRAFTVTLQPGTYTLSADKPSIWHIIAPVDGVFNQKITVDVETTYNCYIASGTYDNVETTPMINAGASALPWEPYTGGKPSPNPEYPQEIVSAGESGNITVEVGGKNLLKPNSYNTYYEFPLKANTVITLMTNGKPSQGGNIKFSATDGSNVWFSIDAGQTRVCRSIGNKDVKGFYDLLKVGGGLEYMLAVGDIKTYTPYVEPQSLTLQTPNGLPGVPVSKDGNYTDSNGQQWVCDEIDLERGKYVQRIWKKMLDGSEVWGPYLTKGYEGFHINIMPFSSYRRNGFCDLFTVKEKSDYEESAWIGVNNSSIYVTKSRFYDPSLEDKGLANWKAFLAENPMTVMTYMDTPIERDLTPEEIAAYKALRTYGPTTVVSNDAGAEMEVTYVADRKEN